MPRKAIDTPAAAGELVPAADPATEALMQQAMNAYAEDRDLINQVLGQIQMADASTQFFRTVRTSKLAYIKESKAYRGLRGMKTPDGPEFSGTWAEFCGLLGRSVDQVDEDIRNYNAMGEDALDAMSRAGIGYRELRQLRKLPDDEREALIEVAKGGNTDALVEIAESLITKHAAEKKALQKTADKATEKVDSLAEQVATQAGQIEQLKADKARLRREWAKKDADERVAALQNAVTEAKLGVIADISLGDPEAGLNGAIQELLGDDTAEQDHTEFLAGVFAEIITAVRQLRDNLPLAVPVRESRK
jgi:hypothetical protein